MSQLRFWLQFAALNKVTSRDQQGHPEPPVAPLSSHRWQSCGWDAPSPAHSVLFLASHSELARIFLSQRFKTQHSGMRMAMGGGLSVQVTRAVPALCAGGGMSWGVLSPGRLLSTPLPGLRQDSILARSNGMGEAGAHLSSGISLQKGWRVSAFLWLSSGFVFWDGEMSAV